jgi:hypothetical protein
MKNLIVILCIVFAAIFCSCGGDALKRENISMQQVMDIYAGSEPFNVDCKYYPTLLRRLSRTSNKDLMHWGTEMYSVQICPTGHQYKWHLIGKYSTIYVIKKTDYDYKTDKSSSYFKILVQKTGEPVNESDLPL